PADERLLILPQDGIRRDGGSGGVEAKVGVVVVETGPDGLAQVPVEAEAERGSLAGTGAGGGQDRKRVIVDLQVRVAADDLERAPGSGGRVEVCRRLDAVERGILTGKDVPGAKLPGAVLHLGHPSRCCGTEICGGDSVFADDAKWSGAV